MAIYLEYEIIENTNMQEETLDYKEYTGCRFENCNLDRCRINNCKFIDCVFSNCRIINPKFEYSVMMGSNFKKCHLVDINWSGLTSGYISPVEDFDMCQIKYNNFFEMKFVKFDFSDNDIIESMFADCDLSDSKFYGCRLDKTEFFRSNMSKADFREAVGYKIDITTCKLSNAVFSFPEVVNLLNDTGIIIE